MALQVFVAPLMVSKVVAQHLPHQKLNVAAHVILPQIVQDLLQGMQ